jgi:hypothetical protein
MPCNLINDGKGGQVIVCGRGNRIKHCVVCGRAAFLLCDYPVIRDGKETTCDRPCCRRHAEKLGPDKDYCRAHAALAKEAKSK